MLDKSFFQKKFRKGLMIFIEEFEVDNYDQYFSVTEGSPSYLKEYIRFYTAHADIRRISNKAFGFRTSEVNQLKKHVKPAEAATLHLWRSVEDDDPTFETILGGWPYLSVPIKGSDESNAQSPEEVPRLRDGTFFARHADSFKYEGRFYNLILAIDGKRRGAEAVLGPEPAEQGAKRHPVLGPAWRHTVQPRDSGLPVQPDPGPPRHERVERPGSGVGSLQPVH